MVSLKYIGIHAIHLNNLQLNNSCDVSLEIKDSNQCISPQSSHSSADDPQT